MATEYAEQGRLDRIFSLVVRVRNSINIEITTDVPGQPPE